MLGRSTSISVIRELGPLLMGLMLSARFGSRNGAELGAMKISEQIDALRAFGTDPIAKLVTAAPCRSPHHVPAAHRSLRFCGALQRSLHGRTFTTISTPAFSGTRSTPDSH